MSTLKKRFFVPLEKKKAVIEASEKQVIKNKLMLADGLKIPKAKIQKITSEKHSIVKAIKDESGKKRARLRQGKHNGME